MFNFKRNNGDKRAFEYADELKMCPSGKVRRVAPPGASESARLVLAEALYETAEQLERDANELRRQGSRFIDDSDPFGPVVGGS